MNRIEQATPTFNNLRAEKARHSLTTQDLATVLGISRQAMTSRYNGSVDLTITEAKLLIDYLNELGSDVTIDTLFFT